MDNKYLQLARQAREADNAEDAKKFYDMVRIDDPDNVEAKFFYAYFNLSDAINKDVPNKYYDYVKVAVSCIKMLKGSTMDEKEKMNLLELIVETHTKETFTIFYFVKSKTGGDRGIYTGLDLTGVNRESVLSLQNMGNEIATLFGTDPKAMQLAAKCWKTIFQVDFFSQWYFFQSGSTREESKNKWNELVKKIQQVDSSYQTPGEPKMIMCGSK